MVLDWRLRRRLALLLVSAVEKASRLETLPMRWTRSRTHGTERIEWLSDGSRVFFCAWDWYMSYV